MNSVAPVTDHQNHYFRVISPFEILVKVGLTPAQVYIGSAQALQEIYEPVTTKPGDEIHALQGGDFLVRPTGTSSKAGAQFGEAYTFDTRRFEAGEIMLHPAPPMPKLPAASLVEIARDTALIPRTGYRGNAPELTGRIRVIA